MAKKKKEDKTEEVVSQLKMYPTEWSRCKKKDEMLYLYHDKKLGRISEEEFDKIKI